MSADQRNDQAVAREATSRAIALRLLAALVALGAGVAAVVIAVLLVHGVLG